MPRFTVTIKIRTTAPPHQEIIHKQDITALHILDPYRKLLDVISEMPAPKEQPDAESE